VSTRGSREAKRALVQGAQPRGDGEQIQSGSDIPAPFVCDLKEEDRSLNETFRRPGRVEAGFVITLKWSEDL
jgi:hypothetical protein